MQTISELTEQIKSLLESTFLHVNVQGEVSRPTYHTSGHLYFTLKDKDAAISCVMFKGNNQKLKFHIEDGMMLDVSGSVSVYSPRGAYQLNCFSANPSGSGALAFAYEQLKKELQQKGYFNQKRPLPKFPKHIAIVTSKTGAALQDMLKVANARYPLVKITLFNALVQGEDAKYSIVKAIKEVQTSDADILILSRGGGSVEDLWAFNEKEVALALYESVIPSVSAVGHAIDTVLSDFVADLASPTPSAAMEMVLPDINEFKMTLDNLLDKFDYLLDTHFKNAKSTLLNLEERLEFLKPSLKIEQKLNEFENLKMLYKNSLMQKINHHFSNLEALKLVFESKNPKNLSKSGFVQVLKNDQICDLKNLKINDEISLTSYEKQIFAKVIKI